MSRQTPEHSHAMTVLLALRLRLSACSATELRRQKYSVLSTAVPGEGFEPPKAMPADLQSAPFGRSGIPAGLVVKTGSPARIRTGEREW